MDLRLACSLLFALAVPLMAVPDAQTITEWSVEARIALSMKVAGAGVQALLPAGWVSDPSTGAANRGANLTVTFMERLLVLDGQGQTRRTGSIRYLVMSAPVRNTASGQAATMIVSGVSPEGPGAYDVYQTATEATVERSATSSMEEAGSAEERWRLATMRGDRLTLTARYRRAAPVRAQVTSVLRSAAHPEFTRIGRAHV